jgi:hypothetical protein
MSSCQLQIDFKQAKIESLAQTVNRELQFVEVPAGKIAKGSVVLERKVYPDLPFKKEKSTDISKHHCYRYHDEYLLITLYKSDFIYKSWYVEAWVTGMEENKPVFSSLNSSCKIKSLRDAFDVANKVHALLLKAFKEKNLKLFRWVMMGQLNEDCEHLQID